jgi:precorrin-2 dehydrogenase/sirohydrochlorin ferrochelatase
MALESRTAAVGPAAFGMKNAKQMFPLFLKLEKRRCLVVGAGAIAESKIAGLVDTGARVRVVAPEATPQVRAWAGARKIAWQRRVFRPADLRGMFLVVAATPSTALHERIFRVARRLGVLCNIVDVPRLCDFYYPAVVRRGALQIAVSTTGHSPALAQRLRKELEAYFGAEYEEWLASVGKAREKINAKKMNAEERKRLLHEMVSREAFEAFRKGGGRKQRRLGGS